MLANDIFQQFESCKSFKSKIYVEKFCIRPELCAKQGGVSAARSSVCVCSVAPTQPHVHVVHVRVLVRSRHVCRIARRGCRPAVTARV